jgi:peptide subunit release factor RF-3
MRAKQLKLGLAQLGEEGAIQVFRPHGGGSRCCCSARSARCSSKWWRTG